MKEQLEKIRQEALDALSKASDTNELDALRVRFLGKKGELTGVLKSMGKLSAEERPVMGQAANNVRAAIEEKLEEAKTALKAKALEAKLEAEAIDVTIPGDPVQLGQGARRGKGPVHLHGLPRARRSRGRACRL